VPATPRSSLLTASAASRVLLAALVVLAAAGCSGSGSSGDSAGAAPAGAAPPAPASPSTASSPASIALDGDQEHYSSVIAEVNGQPIYSAFYEQSLSFLRARVSQGQQGNVEAYLRARYEALDRLIDDELIYQDAKKEGLAASDDDVRAELARATAAAGGEERFFGGMKTQRISRTDAIEGIRRRLTVNKYMRERVASGLTATDQEGLEYYNANIARFTPEAWVKLYQISILSPNTAGPDKAAQARQRAEKILANLQAGASFETMAREFSEDASSVNGGNIGFLKRGASYPEFDAVMFTMKPGEISPVIHTSDGFHILKVVEKRGGSPRPYEAVKEDCRNMVMTRKQAEIVRQITAHLRESASIVSHLD